jgi:hypothetical protein
MPYQICTDDVDGTGGHSVRVGSPYGLGIVTVTVAVSVAVSVTVSLAVTVAVTVVVEVTVVVAVVFAGFGDFVLVFSAISAL